MKICHLKFALIAAFLLFVAQPVVAKEKWINLRSSNFNVVSNADETNTRNLILKLEQFRFVFVKLFKIVPSQLPVTVVVFKDDSSYKPFKPLYNGKPANIAGYFQRAQDENLITLNLSAKPEEHPFSVIFHEYTHLLTSTTPRPWPVWLTEGIAELYSTFDVEKNKVTLGAPVSSHVYLLRENKFVPFQDLFRVTHDSPIYNERQKQGIFYAESWALAHYLMFGDKMARQPQLVQFVRLIDSGVDPVQAFTQAFNTDFAKMEKSLREYVGRNFYTVTVQTFESVEGEKQITVNPLSDAEVQCYLGNILLHTNRLDESENYYKQALSLDANSTMAHEGLGFIAMRRRKYSEAKEQFKQAVTRDSKNFMAHYYYAETIEREASDNAMPLTAEQAKTMTEELKAAIKLMPNFAPAYSLLGFVGTSPGGDLQEGLQAMKRAVQLEPQNKFFKINLANIQAQLKDYAGAKKTLQPILDAPDNDDSGAKVSAQSMLKAIENYERYASERIEIHSNSTPDKESPPAEVKERAGSETSRPSPPPRLQTSLDTAEKMRGVITAVECKGTSMTITLKSDEKTARFFVTDHNRIPFFSRAHEFNVDIVCGPNKIPAIIYFKSRTGNSPIIGDAVAVEFTK